MIKKGIILSGGKGSRLGPITKSVNKQLLPLYDKPMIFYPLSVLMLAGIRDILIITNKNEIRNFQKLLNDGDELGIKISFLEQEKPKSNLAITGLYFFDSNVTNIAKKLKPSKRNELEIVDLIREYLKKNKLKIELMGRGSAWLDAGSADSLFETSQFINSIEKRQGLKIACLEEIALNNKWINSNHIKKRINFYGKNKYSEYLQKLI